MDFRFARARQEAEFPLERAVARQNVQRRAAFDGRRLASVV